jgi:hypothetical protein
MHWPFAKAKADFLDVMNEHLKSSQLQLYTRSKDTWDA